MKTAHQIAAELVDAWPRSFTLKSGDKMLLAGLIAEALSAHRVAAYRMGVLRAADSLHDSLFLVFGPDHMSAMNKLTEEEFNALVETFRDFACSTIRAEAEHEPHPGP